MILVALVMLPALAGVGAYTHREAASRTVWLMSVAVLHVVLTVLVCLAPPPPVLGGWISVDALGLVVLVVVSLLFLVTAVYTVGYLRREDPRGGRAFVSCLLAFLSAASLVAVSHHFAVLWVGMEATTLAVAPLIFHRHDRRSLEAVWKYLVLSSVAIALALLGTFFLATAQSAAPGGGRPLVLEDLVVAAPRLHGSWLKGAFIFLLVGYGTKMGLAPLHTWKPDTYGEAPSLVGGLMAGSLTTCAFLGLARITEVVLAAGLAPFVRPLFLGFGLVSMAVAAVFVILQTDLRRLLAYSSVEHMGLMTLALGLGGMGAYGSVLHAVNNAITKSLLFLCVGNVVLATGSSLAKRSSGLLKTVPVSGALLLLALFAVTGSPPFGPFVSVFTILQAALGEGYPWIAAAVVALMAVIFVGMARMILGVLYGEGPPGATRERENGWLLAGPAALALAVVVLGVYIPLPLQSALARAASALGGHGP